MSFFLMLKLMRSTETAETTGPFFYYLPISQYFRELHLNLNSDTMAALSDESMNPAVAAEWIKMTLRLEIFICGPTFCWQKFVICS